MKYLSLFSGIGGFELGIQQAYEDYNSNQTKESVWLNKASLRPKGNIGMPIGKYGDGRRVCPTCIGFSEIDKYAIQIYQKHFNHKNYGDVQNIKWEEVPDFDLLVGGFPCQSFSIAGKRKGFEDTRGTLFFDIAKGLKIKQPNLVVLENVKGLMSHDKGKTLEIILETLQELGYYVNIEIHNSKFYGVPQNRERIIFICRHIKTIIKDGQNLNLNISSQIISEYLFQILLNNLTEVQKLQEVKSKDWVIGFLLLKEILKNGVKMKQESLKTVSVKLLGKSKNKFQQELYQQSVLKDMSLEEGCTKDGILMVMEEKKYTLKTEDLYMSIAILLSNKSEEDLQGKKLSTILTAIKQTIDQKTYTFTTLSQNIGLATVLLRNSPKTSWNKILLDLILVREHTKKYARLNDKKKEVIITETGNAYIIKNLQDFSKYFIVGHLRGTSRPEVFPFGGDSTTIKPKIIGTTKSDTAKGTNSRSWVHDTSGIIGAINATEYKQPKQILQTNKPKHSNDRVYSEKGISPTLNTAQGGNRQPFVSLQYKGLCDRLGTYDKKEERNSLETLRVLQEKIGTETFTEWGFRILNSFQQKKVLQPILYGKGFGIKTKEKAPKMDDGSLSRKEDMPERELCLLWKSKGGSSSQKPRLARQFIRELGEGLSELPHQDTQMRIRRLTPTEAERLQGFPDGWTEGLSDTQRYKTLGNAVTTNVVKQIIHSLYTMLL